MHYFLKTNILHEAFFIIMWYEGNIIKKFSLTKHTIIIFSVIEKYERRFAIKYFIFYCSPFHNHRHIFFIFIFYNCKTINFSLKLDNIQICPYKIIRLSKPQLMYANCLLYQLKTGLCSREKSFIVINLTHSPC